MVEFLIMVVAPIVAFAFLASGIIHYMMEERRRERKNDIRYLESLIERQTMELIKRMEDSDED